MATDHHRSKSTGDVGASPEVPAVETMIIRTWFERGHTQGFRARITYGLTPGNEQRTVLAADHDEVLWVVAKWLAAQPGVTSRNN